MTTYNDLLRQRDDNFFRTYGRCANIHDFKKLLDLFGFSGCFYCGKGLAYTPDGVQFFVSGHDYDYLSCNYKYHWSFSGCVKPYFAWDEAAGIITFLGRK